MDGKGQTKGVEKELMDSGINPFMDTRDKVLSKDGSEPSF